MPGVRRRDREALPKPRGKQEAMFCTLERRVQGFREEKTHIISRQCCRRYNCGCVVLGRLKSGLSLQGSQVSKDKKARSKRTKTQEDPVPPVAEVEASGTSVLYQFPTPSIFAQTCEDPPASLITNFLLVKHQGGSKLN